MIPTMALVLVLVLALVLALVLLSVLALVLAMTMALVPALVLAMVPASVRVLVVHLVFRVCPAKLSEPVTVLFPFCGTGANCVGDARVSG